MVFAATAGTARAEETAGNDGWLFDIRVDHRSRYEALNNQFRTGLGEHDQLLSLTTSVYLTGERGPISFVGEFIDVRGYFDDLNGSVDANDINAAELVQAYVSLNTTGNKTIAGRFTMDLGSRRLVGRNRFRTATNAFFGVLSTWTNERSERISLFYTLPLVRLPDSSRAVRDNVIAIDRQDFDLQFWGGHYARDWSERLLTEGFFFALQEQDDPDERETKDREIYTFGGRVLLKPAPEAWDIEIEAGYQWGTSRGSALTTDRETLDVSAQYLHAELGYRFDGASKSRISLDMDYASGDKSPGDNSQNRFDALFGPIAGDLGFTSLNSLISRSNLISPALRYETSISERIRATAAWRVAWLASKTDSFGSSGVQDPTGASGRYAGQQIDAKLRVDVIPGCWTIEAGASLFVNGAFFDEAPNANDTGNPLYSFVETRVSF